VSQEILWNFFTAIHGGVLKTKIICNVVWPKYIEIEVIKNCENKIMNYDGNCNLRISLVGEF